MPDTWKQALKSYSYCVDLSRFKYAENFPGWFEKRLNPGNREQTIEFENYFRARASQNIEVWYEVVFWKLASHKGRANYHTPRVISRLLSSGTTSHMLWDACHAYIENPTRANFRSFRKLLFPSLVVPVAATFPAFIAPERFPMVDRQISDWVGDSLL